MTATYFGCSQPRRASLKKDGRRFVMTGLRLTMKRRGFLKTSERL